MNTNFWEVVKGRKKVALEVGERVYIAYPEMIEEIEKEWREEGIPSKIVCVSGFLSNFYETQSIH